MLLDGRRVIGRRNDRGWQVHVYSPAARLVGHAVEATRPAALQAAGLCGGSAGEVLGRIGIWPLPRVAGAVSPRAGGVTFGSCPAALAHGAGEGDADRDQDHFAQHGSDRVTGPGIVPSAAAWLHLRHQHDAEPQRSRLP